MLGQTQLLCLSKGLSIEKPKSRLVSHLAWKESWYETNVMMSSRHKCFSHYQECWSFSVWSLVAAAVRVQQLTNQQDSSWSWLRCFLTLCAKIPLFAFQLFQRTHERELCFPFLLSYEAWLSLSLTCSVSFCFFTPAPTPTHTDKQKCISRFPVKKHVRTHPNGHITENASAFYCGLVWGEIIYCESKGMVVSVETWLFLAFFSRTYTVQTMLPYSSSSVNYAT